MKAEEFFEKQEKKEKLKRRLQLAAIPAYYAVYIPLMLLCHRVESEYLFELMILAVVPGLYYLSLFKVDLLFEIQYLFKLDVKDPEPSDWYYMTTRFFAYVLMILGLLIPLVVYIYSMID